MKLSKRNKTYKMYVNIT